MKIILLGKPLSGKGTQASFLAKKLHIPHISTGTLLRKEIQRKSALGRKVALLLEKGKLVPDPLMFTLLKKHLPQKNFILDGYPRTLAQAQDLEKICSLDLVLEISCPDQVILQRSAARKSCRECGEVYGLHIPPKKKDICDRCQGVLEQRSDDRVSTVKKRLAIYAKETKPLLSFYQKKNISLSVPGDSSLAFLHRKMLQKIESIK